MSTPDTTTSTTSTTTMSSTTLSTSTPSTIATTTTIMTTTVAPIIFDEGLSGGSVFTLLFFTALAIYFGGGILLRKFMRGAEGVEMIPHYAFWVDLPNLIKEGIQFTLNGCEPVVTYERI